MINRFEILSHDGGTRPDADAVIFCDGAGGDLFQPTSDLELSHWRPNRTPPEYRAGTSTEICFRFLDRPCQGEWTVAVNNHVDVDGILSVYALVHSKHALAHRAAIVQAAEMGDFWSWGEPPAQRVFQGLTQLMCSGGQGKDIYEEAFRRIPALIDGSHPEAPQIERTLEPLRQGVRLVERGQIVRSLLGERLAHYVIPLTVSGADDERANYVPEFNEAISENAILWPHVRAKWDAERICLVSTERRDGWRHDLWFPGYLWADTESKWRVPGLEYDDGMGGYTLDNPPLVAAFEKLAQQETAAGSWGLGGTSLPFAAELQNRFPLGGRFLDEQGESTTSSIPPQQFARLLADAMQAIQTEIARASPPDGRHLLERLGLEEPREMSEADL